MKYIDENGLLYLVQKIKNWDGTKVDKVEGKGLSTNDYDAAAVAEVAKIANKVDAVEGKGLSSNDYDAAAVAKVAASQSATEVEAIVTGKGYQTASDVTSAITSALSGFTGIDFSIVEALPETGAKGIIYLISNSGTNPNIYDEYIWVTDKFEKIGTTDVDLSGYVQSSDLTAIQNTEIDTIIASASE